VEDKIEKRPPSPETAPFFIFVHRLLPQKTKENPCKKKKKEKSLIRAPTRAMRSPRLPSPPSQTPATAGLQESESLPLTDTQRSLILLPGRKRRAKILPHRVLYKKP